MRGATLTFVVVTVLSLAGCSRQSQSEPETFTSEDLQAARRAMALSEVSLSLRSGYNQKEIVKQIQQRRIPGKPDKPTEDSFRRFGAKPDLIDALKNDANLLTPAQQRAYQQLAVEQQDRAQASQIAAEQNRLESYAMDERAERQRKQNLAEQTLQNAQNMQDRVTLYEKAHREYTIKKGQLEYQIAKEQAYINQARGRGAGDEALTEKIEALDKYKLELSQLKEPER